MDSWQKTPPGATPPAPPLPECSWAQGPGPEAGRLLTGGSCATPRCAVAGSGGSPLCPGSSHAGGNAAARARRSRWPQGRRLCCGDRWETGGGLGTSQRHPARAVLSLKVLTADPCAAAKAQASAPLCWPPPPLCHVAGSCWWGHSKAGPDNDPLRIPDAFL